MLLTLVFSTVAMNQGLFLVSSVNEQVCGSWEGAWPSWPVDVFHTGRKLSAFFVMFFSQEIESSLGQEFKHFFGAANWSLGGEKNSIVYSFIFIFVITMTVSSISSTGISFVAILNCLYLSP